jgi:hypothetical protein
VGIRPVLFFALSSFWFASGCGEKEKALAESDRKLTSLSDEESDIICAQIEDDVANVVQSFCRFDLAGTVSDGGDEADACAEDWDACGRPVEIESCSVNDIDNGTDESLLCEISVRQYVECIEAISRFCTDVNEKVDCETGVSQYDIGRYEKIRTQGSCKEFFDECVPDSYRVNLGLDWRPLVIGHRRFAK